MKARRKQTSLTALALILITAGCAATTRHSTPAHLARVAFCQAEGLTAQQTTALAGRIISLNPQIVWFRGPLFDATDTTSSWRAIILGENLTSATERGPVFITAINPADPLTPETPGYTQLMNFLSHTNRPWKIVLMEHSLVLPNIARKRLALTTLLQREQTALAIAADATGYARSIPIGPDTLHTVRHVILGSANSPAQPGAEPAPGHLAATMREPHLVLLEATENTLHWTLYDIHGTVRDILTLRRGPTSARFVSVTEIMANENAAKLKLTESPAP